MPEYRVRWEIDIEAESAKQAAEKALEMHRDPESVATVFGVQPAQGAPGGRWELFDL